jgi:hypothetical protein
MANGFLRFAARDHFLTCWNNDYSYPIALRLAI